MKFLRTKAEPLLALVAIATTLALLITRNTAMSDITLMTIVAIFALAVLGYGAFVFKERPADERESELSLIASKYAYLIGAGVLVIGIITETLNHSLNPWLPAALTCMVVVKSLTYFVKK